MYYYYKNTNKIKSIKYNLIIIFITVHFIILISYKISFSSNSSGGSVNNNANYYCTDSYINTIKIIERDGNTKRRDGSYGDISKAEEMKKNPELYQKVIVKKYNESTYILESYEGLPQKQMIDCQREIKRKYCIDENGRVPGYDGDTSAQMQCAGGLLPPGKSVIYSGEIKKPDQNKGVFIKNEIGELEYFCTDAYNAEIQNIENKIASYKYGKINSLQLMNGKDAIERLKKNPKKYQKVNVYNVEGDRYSFRVTAAVTVGLKENCLSEIRKKYCINESDVKVGSIEDIVTCNGGIATPPEGSINTDIHNGGSIKNDIPKGGFRKNEKGVWVNY